MFSATGNASRRNNFCWPDEVSRPYCYLADMRSIAASGNFGTRPTFSDCLAILRTTERSGTELKSAKMKCSGVERAESVESVSGRGRNRADILVRGSGFGASACPRPSASGGSVTQGLHCCLISSELLLEITKNGWRCFAKCQGELKIGSHARKGKPVSAGFRLRNETKRSASRRARVAWSREVK